MGRDWGLKTVKRIPTVGDKKHMELVTLECSTVPVDLSDHGGLS